MRHAVVVNGVVVAILMADTDMASQNGWIPTEEAGLGWEHDGEKFISHEVFVDGFAEEARAKRNVLLQETDVHIFLDRWARMTTEQQQSWSDYRQALRDIPLQQGFPMEIDWPVKPE